MNDQERKDFMETSMPVVCQLGDEHVVLQQKQFASGSVGWHGNSKISIHGCRVQCNLILTVVGSKPVQPSTERGMFVSEDLSPHVDDPEALAAKVNGKHRRKRS